MHRRQSQPRSFGTALAVAVLLLAVAYQIFTKGLPDQLSVEAAKIAPTYDVGAAREALQIFRGKN